jgi:hypothetical protein
VSLWRSEGSGHVAKNLRPFMSNTREYVLQLGYAETKVGIPREFRELRALFGQAVGLVYGRHGAKRPLRCSLKSRPKMPCEEGGGGQPCRAPARWCGFRGKLVEELLSAIPMCWPALDWFVKSLPHPLTDAYQFDMLQFGSDYYRPAAICGIAWCGNARALIVSLLTGTDRAAECDTEGFVSIRGPVPARA